MDRILLIDGYNFIFRAYYSHQAFMTSDRIPTGALYGFTSMMLKLLNSRSFDYIVLVCDSGSKNFRHDLYPEYKANRTAAPSELIEQLALIDQAAEALSVKLVRYPGFEADDIIATIARKASAKGLEVEIVSSDKDLMQLIGPGVYMYDPIKEKVWHSADVEEKFGVKPERLQDLLALVGDSSDNIPGVSGIGVKTASKLINEFGSLSNLLANIDSISHVKQKNSIKNAIVDIELSYKLVQLRFDAPVPDGAIDDYRLGEPKSEFINLFINKYEFRTLTGRFEKLFNRSFVEHNDKSVNVMHTVANVKETGPILTRIFETGLMAIDFFIYNEIPRGVLIQAGYLDDCYYLPLRSSQNGCMSFAAKNEITLSDFFDVFAEALTCDDVIKICYNAKYLISLAAEHRVDVNAYKDLSMMFYAINSYAKDSSIGAICVSLGQERLIEKKMRIERAENIDDEYHNNLQNKANNFLPYLALYPELARLLVKKSVCYVYEAIDNPLIKVLSEAEGVGVMIDRAYLYNMLQEFNREIDSASAEVYRLAGKEFNINSPKQLNEILFEQMGLERSGKSTKAGIYSTDSSALEALEDEGIEIASRILRWRHVTKLVNTYIVPLLKKADASDRVHTNYLINNTITGRLSSIEPNLQNIPIRTDDGKKIRKAFVAPKDRILISADYSQIELRVLAHYAQIVDLIASFKKNIDVHNVTAAKIFGIKSPDQVDEHMRRKAKIINFGMIYGISAFGLKRQLGCSYHEAEQYMREYFATHPEVRSYMDRIKNEAKINGFVRTIYNRYCFLPNINHSNPALRSYAERTAINAPIQGSAADIMKIAMRRVDRLLKTHGMRSKVIMQIHDELVLECVAEEKDRARALLQKGMVDGFFLSAPLAINVAYGQNWLDMHDL